LLLHVGSSTTDGVRPASATVALRLAVCGVAALACASCAAERKLVIRSEPEGAIVRLDNQVVGTTPYETNFDSYGTRRITLYKAGYLPYARVLKLEPPWYADFPADLLTEVIFPYGWSDVRIETCALQPVREGEISSPDLEAVLLRAESLRRAEPAGPRPSTVPPTTPTP